MHEKRTLRTILHDLGSMHQVYHKKYEYAVFAMVKL